MCHHVGDSSMEEEVNNPRAKHLMAVSGGWELPGTGGVLQRLCESHLSGMLRKEMDHITSKRGPPTPALCVFPSVQVLWWPSLSCKLFHASSSITC